MGKQEKILEKMRQNPRDWRIDDLKVVARRNGLVFRQPGTSHVTFTKGAIRLTVPSHKPIKPVYVRRFVDLIDSLVQTEEYVK